MASYRRSYRDAAEQREGEQERAARRRKAATRRKVAAHKRKVAGKVVHVKGYCRRPRTKKGDIPF